MGRWLTHCVRAAQYYMRVAYARLNITGMVVWSPPLSHRSGECELRGLTRDVVNLRNRGRASVCFRRFYEAGDDTLFRIPPTPLPRGFGGL